MSHILNFYTPAEVKSSIARKAKNVRLQKHLTRRTLALMSGVSLSSIKRFETTGQVSLTNLLKIANALGVLDDFNSLFEANEPQTLAELEKREKKLTVLRGRI